MSTALTSRPDTGFLTIDSFDQAIKVADYINKSALVPDAYRGKPADIVIAMQYGMELGLSPMQALQSVSSAVSPVPRLAVRPTSPSLFIVVSRLCREGNLPG